MISCFISLYILIGCFFAIKVLNIILGNRKFKNDKQKKSLSEFYDSLSAFDEDVSKKAVVFCLLLIMIFWLPIVIDNKMKSL
jgi:hypothetical protein